MVNDRSLCPDGRGLNQDETSIAVSGAVVVAAFNDSRGVCDPDNHATVGWSYSLDNGETWVDGGGLPESRSLNDGDPWLGVSPDGQTFYLSGIWDIGHGFGFYRGRVTVSGIEWSPPTIVAPAILFFPRDKEAFTVDPNRGTIYLTYTAFDTGGIWVVRSEDQGETWCEPVPVFRGPAQGSFPAVDNQGNLFVAYLETLNAISVSMSSDGAASFEPLISFPIQTGFVTYVDRASQFPQIAIDNSYGDRDGWVYLVWHSRTGIGESRNYISHSEDRGATWSAPAQINTDDAIAYRWWPSVSVDSNGSVNVISLDRRNHPDTGLTDCFFAQSTDGGNTFSEIQVTDVTSSWEGIRHDSGFTYAGDYIRAVSQGTTVYAVWTDPRSGDPDIYFSRIDAGGFAAASLGARQE